ncbi:transcriptional regulator [Proteus mirabilis]
MYLINDDIIFYSDKNLLFSKKLNKEKKILAPSSKMLIHLITVNELVTQRELFRIGWGDKEKFITNSAFYQNILLLRKAFNELDIDDEIVITVPRKGYIINHNISIEKLSDNNIQDIKLINENKISDIPHIKKEIEEDINTNINDKDHSLSSIKKTSISLSKKKLFIIIFTLIVLFFVVIFTFNYLDSRKHKLYNYSNCGTYKKYNLFCNKEILNEEKENLIDNYISSYSDYNFIYITESDSYSRTSLILCKKKFSPINFLHNQCVSIYVLDNKK